MVVVSLSLIGIAAPAKAQDFQDLNELDAVINNLIKLSGQTPPPILANTNQSVHNVYPTNVHYNSSTTPGNYSNPFLTGVLNRTQGHGAPYEMAQFAAQNALNKSTGWCALYVRKALQSAGYKVKPQPSAYMYNNGEMSRIGFKKIPPQNYQPQVGDVIVFNRTPSNPHGHIQIWTGAQWVSDFKQPRMMIYGDNHRGYIIWRDAKHIDAVMQNNHIFLAMNS